MSRRGFNLMELLVALGLAAGPMLVAVHLVHTNVQGARFNQERATARLVLIDMMELLLGETNEQLKEISGPSSTAQLRDRLDRRIGSLPEPARKPYREQVAPLMKGLSCKIEENVEGQRGLSRFTLRVVLSNSVPVEVKRLFRPNARPGASS